MNQTATDTAPRFERVTIKTDVDPHPDLSYLGEYRDTPGPENRTIDRAERGDAGRGEYRYFVAAMSGDETGNPASVEQDYQRMEAYNRGDWCALGIWAEAVVTANGVQQTIRSGGLWGIESDADADYHEEIGCDELADLRGILEGIGVRDLPPRLTPTE